MSVETVSITVPPGAMPGQQISFQAPDGRKVTLVVPDGVVPGQGLQVTITKPAGSAPAPGEKKKKKRKKMGDDSDDEDDEFVPRPDADDIADDIADGKKRGVPTDADVEPLATQRPRRLSAGKTLDKINHSTVSDAAFEAALDLQQKKKEEKAAEKKKKSEERAKEKAAMIAAAAKAQLAAEKAAEEGVPEGEGEEDEIETIVDVKKGPHGLVYEIKWKGHERPEDNTWEPESNLHDEIVADFKRDYPELVQSALDGDVEIEVVTPGAAPPAEEDAAAAEAPAPEEAAPAAAPETTDC